ncbi:MAG: alanine racemase [Erysipelotrichaceae bacterium]|nr:alanine racemase [Erysipelotrichaceae bacterium]
MYREAYVKIDIDAFKYNIKNIIEKSKKKIIAIIKADAYGCGAKYLFNAAVEAGASMFGVSSLEEAIKLREDGCNSDILILGHTGSENLDLIKQYDFILTSVSKDWVNEFSKFDGNGIKVHIKVDTGMNRIGLKTLEEVNESIKLLNDSNYKVDGIYTHFACADEDFNKKTKSQYEMFKNIVEKSNYDFKWIHCSNSDASLSIEDNLCNSVRIGLSLYGVNAYYKDLKPVVSLLCKIVNIKTLHEGETVSYGATYVCNENDIIATVPLGYADGLRRNYSGRRVFIEGASGQIVGRVCMDQTMIKLDKIMPLKTEVEIFGTHIPLEEVAEDLDTVAHEILTSLSDRLTRIYIEEGKYLTDMNPRLKKGEINQN